MQGPTNESQKQKVYHHFTQQKTGQAFALTEKSKAQCPPYIGGSLDSFRAHSRHRQSHKLPFSLRKGNTRKNSLFQQAHPHSMGSLCKQTTYEETFHFTIFAHKAKQKVLAP